MKPWSRIFPSLISLSASLAMFACNGSQASSPPVLNPLPSIASVSPTSVPAGGSSFTLTVNGSGFVPASEVHWNGAIRATTFVSSTQLMAAIPASDISSVGSASVTVFNPAPGGGSSNVSGFSIAATIPFNDDFANAAVVSSQPFTNSEDTRVATTEASDPTICAGNGGKSVWYRFTPTSTGTVTADTFGSGYNTVLSVWTGAPGAFTHVACNDDTATTIESQVGFTAISGTTYFFMVTSSITPTFPNGGPLTFHLSAVTVVGGIERVSVASDGTQGDNDSCCVALSADGRFVAFISAAPNLVANDTNAFVDILVHDRQTGQTSRASVATDGTEGNGNSGFPALSADGRFVAFESTASNFVPGDTNGIFDIFLRDTCVGAPPGCTPSTARVSVASDGSQAQGNEGSFRASLSADGRFIAFMSDASNLVPGDTNGIYDVFVHDRQTGQTSRVSVASDGAQARGGDSVTPFISADGRFVAFSSLGSNLFAGDTNGEMDVFLRDTCVTAPAGCAPSTMLVSASSDGVQGNNQSWVSSLSPDGRFVTFYSIASNLVAGDTNGGFDVFVRDTCLGAPPGCTPATERVSVASGGAQGNGSSSVGSLSADGRFVTFVSDATNLVADDTNGFFDIFLHDRQTNQTTRLTASALGQAIGDSFSPVISSNGGFVAFDSFALNLVAGDTNGSFDVFVRPIGNALGPVALPNLRINGATFDKLSPRIPSSRSDYQTTGVAPIDRNALLDVLRPPYQQKLRARFHY